MEKSILLYFPYELSGLESGSRVRPNKIIQGFRNLGYEIFLIKGNSITRKGLINKVIKENQKDLQKATDAQNKYTESIKYGEDAATLALDNMNMLFSQIEKFSSFKIESKYNLENMMNSWDKEMEENVRGWINHGGS